ncbi:MAG: DUF2953 domain-containing protein [archaeon]|nr:DUF2953 domain-containing protein [archaeon]
MIYLIVAIIILIFLLIVASLLLIPFHISLHFFMRGSLIQGSFHISWLGITFIRRKIFPEERKKKKEEKKFDWRSIPEMISLFTESFPYLKHILNAFMKSISIERFSCNVTMGLDSPADTAMISGYMWSLASLVNVFPKAYLSVKPDFQEKRLDGSMMVELKVRLLWIAVALIRAFSKKPIRQLFRKMGR